MDIPIAEDVATVRSWRQRIASPGHLAALVPTMGALHQGHLNLIEQAARECEDVIVSIFVNPTQFAANEDLSTYPVDFDKDYAALMDLNRELTREPTTYKGKVTLIFRPNSAVMYPLPDRSKLIMNDKLTKVLEGGSRPHFFAGVTTVVSKLFNITQPDRAYFGQKDIQQVVVIQRMIQEFHFPTVLRCIETVREEDGLAMSSRNVYLGQRRRAAAIVLKQALDAAYRLCTSTNHASRDDIMEVAEAKVLEFVTKNDSAPVDEQVEIKLDYVSMAHPRTLQELANYRETEGAILSGALVIQPLKETREGEILGLGRDAGSVRIIDNILVGAAAKEIGVVET